MAGSTYFIHNSEDGPPAGDVAATRRQFFAHCGLGMGSIALTSLMGSGGSLQRALQGAEGSPRLIKPLAPKSPHFAARAKNVIYLFMLGGPSHLDLFDNKQKLRQLQGQPIPESYVKGEQFAQITEKQPKILGSPYDFGRYGSAGVEVSELLPHTRSIVDDLAFIRTVKTDETVHPHAQLLLFTGLRIPGRPSMGSWVTYGLGSESQDLPGFVVLVRGMIPQAHDGIHSSGFLPATHAGVKLHARGAPILNLADPPGVTRADTRRVLDAVKELNNARLALKGDAEIAARTSAYELAFRLQASAPDLMDLRKETDATFELYGARRDQPSFSHDCLLARRLVERGVRFVQLSFGNWDHHGDIFQAMPPMCNAIDRACTGLIKDLKQRGMLDDTLVVWGGEFGRTPVAQPQKSGKIGRDHHTHAFTMWLAGGGVKAGADIGTTDDLGYFATADSVHLHDLQATILHLLGLNHEELTYRFQGRDFRLTDVHGHVVEELIA